jgi:anti-anti-sigma factor
VSRSCGRIERHYGPGPGSRGAVTSFRLCERRLDDSVVLIVAGDLDRLTVPMLADAVHEYGRGDRRVVVDLRQVEFIDCRALDVLVGLVTEAGREGWHVAIVKDSRATQRMFKVAGIVKDLPLIDTACQACACR